MLVDMLQQALQIRREFLEYSLSLLVAKLIGVRPNPLQQRNRLRAGSLYATAPRRAAFLRGSSHHLYSSSSTSKPRRIIASPLCAPLRAQLVPRAICIPRLGIRQAAARREPGQPFIAATFAAVCRN
jgi:hypothetical protein